MSEKCLRNYYRLSKWRPQKSLVGVISKSKREEKSKGGNKIVLHNFKNVHTGEQNILERSTLRGFSQWVVLCQLCKSNILHFAVSVQFYTTEGIKCVNKYDWINRDEWYLTISPGNSSDSDPSLLNFCRTQGILWDWPSVSFRYTLKSEGYIKVIGL